MKATVARRQLLAALDLARKWVSPPKELPLLFAVQLRATGSGLSLVRTDLDREIYAQLDATVTRPGEAIVSASALYRIAKTSRNTTLELTLSEAADGSDRNGILGIRANLADYALVALLAPEGFPALPVVEGTAVASQLPAATLRWLLGATAYAAGNPKDSPTDCVELRFVRGNISAGATDGVRAAIADVIHQDVTEPATQLYLPGDTAERLVATKDECMVRLGVTSDKRLEIALGNAVRLSCRTLDRTYPDIAGVAGKYDTGEEIVAQREQLLAALARAAAVLGEAAVLLTAEDDQITISGENVEGARIVERFPARAGAGTRSVGVNPAFATDALAAISASEVSLRISERALVVRPVLQDDMTQSQVAIVMPVRIEKRPDAVEPAPDATQPQDRRGKGAKRAKSAKPVR